MSETRLENDGIDVEHATLAAYGGGLIREDAGTLAVDRSGRRSESAPREGTAPTMTRVTERTMESVCSAVVTSAVAGKRDRQGLVDAALMATPEPLQ